MLTDKDKKRYMEYSCKYCPYCGSHRVDYVELPYIHPVLKVKKNCWDCEKEWTDILTVTDVEEKEMKPKSNINTVCVLNEQHFIYNEMQYFLPDIRLWIDNKAPKSKVHNLLGVFYSLQDSVRYSFRNGNAILYPHIQDRMDYLIHEGYV